jgi:hypothetical protein
MGRSSSEVYLLGGLDGVSEPDNRGLDDIGENLTWRYGDEGGEEEGPLCDHERKKEDIYCFFLCKTKAKGRDISKGKNRYMNGEIGGQRELNLESRKK